jgi:hypothetical protein
MSVSLNYHPIAATRVFIVLRVFPREPLHRLSATRCVSNRLMQGAKRRQYVDIAKFCNAAADDSRRNPLMIQSFYGTGQFCPRRCCYSLVYLEYTAVGRA